MSRFSFLLTLAFMPLLSAGFAAENQTRKVNIVFIMADDLGYECISANGCEDYKTPVIDKLAADGVRFTQCFANPLCTPSRVKLMTGLYNQRNYRKFGKLSRSETTFANLLKKAGYATAIAGKWQLGSQADSPQHFGFDQSCLWQHRRGATRKGSRSDSRYRNPELDINGKPVDYNDGEYGPDICCNFLCDFIKTNKNKPFLVYYPMILPHSPICPTPDSKDWDHKSPGDANGRITESEKKRLFKDMVQYIDKMVGKIITTLETNGLRERTLVIFTGDNGTIPILTKWNGRKVEGGKRFVTDEGTRVPLIVNWPGHIKPRVDERELVEFSDFLPTLCEAAGVPLPKGYPGDGASLMPVLTGDGNRTKPFIYIFHWKQAWARTVNYGVLHRSKEKSGYVYQKFGGHYDKEEIKLDSVDESGRTTLERLRKVVDSFNDLGRERKGK